MNKKIGDHSNVLIKDQNRRYQGVYFVLNLLELDILVLGLYLTTVWTIFEHLSNLGQISKNHFVSAMKKYCGLCGGHIK